MFSTSRHAFTLHVSGAQQTSALPWELLGRMETLRTWGESVQGSGVSTARL